MESVRDLSWANEPGGNYTFEPRSYVYFISAGDIAVDGTPVKVGISGEPYMRLHGIQQNHWSELTLVATAPGGLAEERHIHDLLSGDRLRGEWFSSSQTLRDVILNLDNAEHYVSVGSGGFSFHD